MAKESFHIEAVNAFERTFRAIFRQSNQEVDRLDRINQSMLLLENQLLDPTVIAEMDTMQQIALMELLTRSQQSTIRNLMSFSTTLEKVRNITGVFDGIQSYTSLPNSPDGDFPLLEGGDLPRLTSD